MPTKQSLLSRFPFSSAPAAGSAARKPAHVLSKTASAVVRALKKLGPRRGRKTALLDDFEVLDMPEDVADADDLATLPTYESIVFAPVSSELTICLRAPALSDVQVVIVEPVFAAAVEVEVEVKVEVMDECLPAYEPTSVLPYAFTRGQVIDIAITPSLVRTVNEVLKEKKRLSFGTLDGEPVADMVAEGLPAPASESALLTHIDDAHTMPQALFEAKIAELTRELEEMCAVSVSSGSVSDGSSAAMADVSVESEDDMNATGSESPSLVCQCKTAPAPVKVYAEMAIQTDEVIPAPSGPPPAPPAPPMPPASQAVMSVSAFIKVRKAAKGGKIMEKIRKESNLGDVIGELHKQFDADGNYIGGLRKVQRVERERAPVPNLRAGLKTTGSKLTAAATSDRDVPDLRAGLKTTGSKSMAATTSDEKASELARMFRKRAAGAASGLHAPLRAEHDDDKLVRELKLALEKRRTRGALPASTSSSSTSSASTPARSLFSSPRTSVCDSPATDVGSPWGSRLRGRAPVAADSPAPQGKRPSAVEAELEVLRSGRTIREDGLSLTALAVVERVKRARQEKEMQREE
ncbi:hypothetical protein FA95DRAFT_1573486 [Auriscalpium vulgare]|uniref:Uncharacterized protein n=1 Tax=Auriscalpium vulgare TaxID=40419 RepID=A0ACB8RPL5_9AGAM|nr:hypothetical protein FA95DRAFT_1573486 [Auriscalpium vulgare]